MADPYSEFQAPASTQGSNTSVVTGNPYSEFAEPKTQQPAQQPQMGKLGYPIGANAPTGTGPGWNEFKDMLVGAGKGIARGFVAPNSAPGDKEKFEQRFGPSGTQQEVGAGLAMGAQMGMGATALPEMIESLPAVLSKLRGRGAQPALPPAQASLPPPRAALPSGAEPDIEMQMRLGTTEPPAPLRPKPAPDRLGTPAQEARMREAMVSRDTAKKALETGGAAPKQIAGTSAGAANDTALFQQAKAENPSGSVSDWAKRAQELKTEKQLVGPDPYAKSAPKMEPTQSTNVNKIGHDGKHMWVEYKTGQVYQYRNVPESTFNAAKNADSVGSYISRNIKGKFETSLKGTARK